MLEAEVVWTGEGTWRPDNICYDWDKVTNKVFVCTFAPGTALSYGEPSALRKVPQCQQTDEGF